MTATAIMPAGDFRGVIGGPGGAAIAGRFDPSRVSAGPVDGMLTTWVHADSAGDCACIDCVGTIGDDKVGAAIGGMIGGAAIGSTAIGAGAITGGGISCGAAVTGGVGAFSETGFPHWRQNFTVAGIEAPHEAQLRPAISTGAGALSGVPHDVQNFRPAAY